MRWTNDIFKKKSKDKSEKEGTDRKKDKERERKKRGLEREKLLSKIYGISNRMFLSEQKAKLVHALRATRRYQNLGVSSNSTR